MHSDLLSRDLRPGTVVGEYVVEKRAASGGMATVYSAVHPTIGKKVAVKVISDELSSDPKAVERFVLEARTVSRISHKNIIEVFGFGTLADGRCYLTMEWLDGETLGERMGGRSLPLVEGCDIFLQVVDALEAAHEAGVIHRDLKPANIYLLGGGAKPFVKLLDFGIAKLLIGEAARRAERLTAEHSTVGTAEYLAPEQAQGRTISGATDLYSLGVVAYEAFLGRLPFESDSIVELMWQHIRSEPTPPHEVWPDIPPALDTLLTALLAKEPEKRPSLPVVREALLQIRDGSFAVHEMPVREAPEPPPAPGHTATTPVVGRPRSLLAWLLIATAGFGLAAGLRLGKHDAHEPEVTTVPPMLMPVASQPAPLVAAPLVTPSAPAIAAPIESSRPSPSPDGAWKGETSIATPRKSVLLVDVDAPNARLIIDGTTQPPGVMRVAVARAGTHTLVVVAPGRQSERRIVEIRAGETLALSVQLRRPLRRPPRHDYIIDSSGRMR
jgi:serine/threonine-protein kinase